MGAHDKMNNDINNAQGHLRIPYDLRRPSLAKIARRLYNPGGPMFSPKVFGVGWTLNFAHPGSRWLLGAAVLAAVVAGCIS